MAHKNKKLLHKTDLSSIDIKGNIYINYNLTPKMKNLAFNCRKLKREKLIINSWPEERSVKIKLKNGIFKKVDHISDLVTLFPEFSSVQFSSVQFSSVPRVQYT